MRKSFKDMSLAELDNLIQLKREKSQEQSKNFSLSQPTFLKDSITFIHPPILREDHSKKD